MRKIFTLVFVLLGLSKVASAQEIPPGPYDLQTAVDIAIANNLTLKRSELNQQIVEADLLQSKGARLPNLSVGGSTNFNWGRSINPATNLFETQRIGNVNLFGSSNLTIYNGGRISHTVAQSKTELEKGMYDIEASKNSIILNVINLYVNVIFNTEQVKIAENQLQTTTEQLDRTRKLVTAGSLPLSDQLDLESQLATNNVDLINAQLTLNTSMLNLAQALQIPYSSDFQIIKPELEVDDTFMTEESPSSIYQKALETMPEIKSAGLAVESADYGIKIARSGYLPTLGIGANLNTNYVDLYDETFGNQLDFNFSQAAGLQLNVPLFSRFTNKASVQRATVQRYLAEVSQKEAQNTLRQNIESAYTNALGAEQSYNASLLRVKSLEETFRIAQQRFDLGAINSTDFQVAQNNLFQAQSQLSYDKYTYLFRIKVLDFYLGNPINLN